MARRFGLGLFLAVLAFAALLQTARADIALRRFSDNPLVGPSSFAPNNTHVRADRVRNINFPSVIRAPSWFSPRLGNYYMYFSDHHGLFVRLAYADRVEGPWKIYPHPTLTLAQVYAANNVTYNESSLSYKAECTSPDVHVDHQARVVRMYFKHRIPTYHYAILSGVAVSHDGLGFAPRSGAIGLSYVRAFTWAGDRGNYTYMLDRHGNMMRSADGYGGWELGNGLVGKAFANQSMIKGGDQYTGRVRHVGVSVAGHMLNVFGSRVGDAPERILWASMDLRCTLADWSTCAPVGPAVDAFRGVTAYEGAQYPVVPSRQGDAIDVNQLRDPFPFADDGKCFIFYTIAGESGIAGGRIADTFCGHQP